MPYEAIPKKSGHSAVIRPGSADRVPAEFLRFGA